MPNFEIVKQHKPKKTFRVASVIDSFDLSEEIIRENFSGNIDIEDIDWNVGVIVGSSGTGKTTIAREISGENYYTGSDYGINSVLDDMPSKHNIDVITSMFGSVGFGSVPSWLKPYHVLSNGEKMRVDIARALLAENDMIVFDEFTSVVDRQVAAIGSTCVQRSVRKSGKKFVAVTCHFDVVDWLEPDWVFDTDRMLFFSDKKKRPKIEIKIYKVERSYWEMFKKHHYLTGKLNKSAHCYVATFNDRPAAFTSIVHFPHPRVSNMKRIHRTVVLPDFQGVGLGAIVQDIVAENYISAGYRITLTTGHRGMNNSMRKNGKWICKRVGRVSKCSASGVLRGGVSSNRLTTSWEFNGAKK